MVFFANLNYLENSENVETVAGGVGWCVRTASAFPFSTGSSQSAAGTKICWEGTDTVAVESRSDGCSAAGRSGTGRRRRSRSTERRSRTVAGSSAGWTVVGTPSTSDAGQPC